MYCRIGDFRYKDVICVSDGTRLGCVNDVEINTATAQLCAIVIYGRLRVFGLFGREDDTVIQWNDIRLIGEDTILVDHVCAPRPARNGLLGRLFG